MSDEIKVGDKLERVKARNRQCAHDIGNVKVVVGFSQNGWRLDSGYMVHRQDVKLGLWRRLPREDAKPALPRRAMSADDLKPGMRVRGKWGAKMLSMFGDDPIRRADVEHVLDEHLKAQNYNHGSHVYFSSAFFGDWAGVTILAEPAAVEAHSLADVMDPSCGAHANCTLGAPCRRDGCGNAADADALERRINRFASDARWYLPARPIDTPAPDPIASMLGAPGVCVMRGRRLP